MGAFFQQAQHLFAALQGLQCLQCPKILHSQMIQHEANRFLRLSIPAGVNLKGVARREHAACVGHFVGIEVGQRELGMIEIIPPLQKALQLIAVQLHAQHPGAGCRHGHEGIGHIPVLPHAVVRPKPRNAGLQEGFQMVDSYNGLFQCAGLIKSKIGKSVDHRPPLQVRLDQRTGVAVAFQMIQRRLVGNVKIGAFRNAQLVQLLHQRGKKLAQEMGVCFAVRVRFPAEQPLFLAVHRGDDLRRGCRAPLRKQMGHFQIGDPAAAADLHPAFQPVKAEGIRALADVNVHQLNGQPLASGRGIQRRREQGRENHGAAPAHSRSDKVFNDRPMLLTENGNTVVFRQTVRMEPVGSNQFLRRKPSRQDRHGNAG